MANPSALEGIASGDRSTFLVLSLCESPTSLDELVAWGFARPVDLWRLLEEARARSAVVEPTPRSGQFLWNGEVDRGRLWTEALVEDWQSALVHPEIVRRAADLAQRAIERRDRAGALALCRALVNARHPDRFPDGEAGFMRSVLLSCCFVHAEWRPPAIVDRAVEIAERLGDRAALAQLLTVRATAHFYAGELGRSRTCLEQAREVASSLDRPDIVQQASAAYAIARILGGELREGIAAFEESLGDVPREVLPALDQLFAEDRLMAFEFVGSLSFAYSAVGQPTRAIDLLHRAQSLGLGSGQKDVVNLARLYLIDVCEAHGDYEAARRWAEEVLGFWRALGNPYFAWFVAIAVAALHRNEGNLAAAREALVTAQEARTRSGFGHCFNRALLEVLEALERSEAAPIDGMTLEGEIERILGWHDSRMKGVAHHFAARRSVAAGREEGVAEHLAESERLLRASGALLDLACTLEERADWEQRRGELAPARDLRREAGEIRRMVPPLASFAAPRTDLSGSLAIRVLELGRLSAIAGHPSVWGDLASRLCSLLAAERCAIVEGGESPRLLALRGGSDAWAQEVIRQVRGGEGDDVRFLPPPRTGEDQGEEGQLVVIPFRTQSFKRTGWVALENRFAQPLIALEDRTLLEALGAQLAVLLENASLWQELQAARHRLEQENRYYRDEHRGPAGGSSIIGHSPALQEMLELAARVASTPSTVLITGETGVGKELVAKEIHQQSSRRTGPFIAVHIASLSPGLVASGLFGHERGAFTGATEQVRGRFELAHSGTLFLDEIGELGAEEQVRLLRVLQEGTFERVGGTRPLRSDFRLVAATNRDLQAEVKAGRFREDLFYRLKVFPIHVPPLRERQEDIPTLALYFMEQAGRRLGRSFEGISEADVGRLRGYPWPGNVRELMHTIERAAVLSDGPRLVIPPLDPGSVASSTADEAAELTTLAEMERRHLRRVLEHTGGRVTGAGGAAEILALKPSTLNFRIRKLGLADLLSQVRSRRPHRQRAS